MNAEERRTALVRLSTSADLAGFRPQPGADQLIDAYLDHADDCLDIVRARTHWRVTLEFSYQAACLAADAILAAMGYRTAAVERAHLGRVQVALEACNVCGIDVADAGRRLEGQAIGLRNRVHYPKSTALRIPLDTVEQLAADLEVLLPAFAEAAWALQGRAVPRGGGAERFAAPPDSVTIPPAG